MAKSIANRKNQQFAQKVAQLADLLQSQGMDIMDDLVPIAMDYEQKIINDIKRDSPRDTGEYAAGWSELRSFKSPTKWWAVVGNKREMIYASSGAHSLVNILEYGHVNRGGKSWTQAKPHVRGNYYRNVNAFQKDVKAIFFEELGEQGKTTKEIRRLWSSK